MNSPTLRQLEVFTAVVQEQSVSGAAASLHVSAGGVSQTLSELERVLGAQLTLRRRGQGVVITAAGQWVYIEAQKVLNHIQEIGATSRLVAGELAGPIRIGCFPTLSPWLFPPIAAHLLEAHPGINPRLEEAPSSTLQQQLLQGGLDVGLMYESHLIAGIQSERLLSVDLQVAVAKTHPLARNRAIHLRELAHEDAILFDSHTSAEHVSQLLRSAGVEPRVRWRSSNIETIRSLVARGLGYTIIMGQPFGDHSYDGYPLSYHPLAEEAPPLSVVAAFPKDTTPTAKAQAVISFLRDGLRPDGLRLRNAPSPRSHQESHSEAGA